MSDPWARRLLDGRRRLFAWVLRLPKLRDVASKRVFAHLAVRTLAYDHTVLAAINAGTTQVVIVAAGFDSRSLRFGRPGVTFFEVDHPATQADKRRRLARLGAASANVRFVAVDLAERGCSSSLIAAGFDSHAQAVFVVEGLTMYLSRDANVSLLEDLAGIAAPGSTLGVDFASPGTAPAGLLGIAARILASVSRMMLARAGERVVLLADADAAKTTVRSAGWNTQKVRDAHDLWSQYLRDLGWPSPRPGSHTPIIVEGAVP